ncbi:MAG: FliH/SctL family protein [Desulfuromonadaceae bacterium]|nr:FliH/SctL family protein [Desulfuromonadaceae bacterium]
MSSSRIIKSEQQEGPGITDFDFRQIGQSAALPDTDRHQAGFVPMGMPKEHGEFTPDNNSPQEEPVEIGPPLVEITEDDLNLRISDSFNAGLKEGKDLAERGLINVFRALRASGETIHNLRDKIFRESEDELINLIMLVARKVIIKEISLDRSILAGVVNNAIAGLSARDEITVRINPEDYLLVNSGREETLKSELLNDRLMLKPDHSVMPGCCMVDTVMGTIDASLEGQMDEIFRHLVEQRTAVSVENP